MFLKNVTETYIKFSAQINGWGYCDSIANSTAIELAIELAYSSELNLD